MRIKSGWRNLRKMNRVEIVTDENNCKVVLIPDIIFYNKQNIDWDKVEEYLHKYIGSIVEVANEKEIIYIGKDFPDEFTSSKYTRNLKGARAKAKANCVQGICEMIEIATDKRFEKNRKKKHASDAANGWYYYTTRFGIYVY